MEDGILEMIFSHYVNKNELNVRKTVHFVKTFLAGLFGEHLGLLIFQNLGDCLSVDFSFMKEAFLEPFIPTSASRSVAPNF